mgnify:CR=1 FL=1
MFGIGPQELIVILVVALLVLGPKRLPEIARSLGKSLAEFRRASSDLRQSLSLDDDPPRRTTPTRAPQQAALAAPKPDASASDDPAEGRSIAPPEPTAPEGATPTQ